MQDIQELTQHVADRLGQVDGIDAVVLGGAWAYPASSLDADVDLYVYYRTAAAPDASTLRAVLFELNADRDLVPDLSAAETPLETWMWVEGQRVSLHYRDFDAVAACVEQGLAGIVGGTYRPGHLHAVFNATVMGEVHDGKPLYDPFGTLDELRALTRPFPYELRRNVVLQFGEEADRVLFTAQRAVGQHDLHRAAGAVQRVVDCVLQVVFAANGRYLAFERDAVHRLRLLPDCPDDAAAVLVQALGTPPASIVDRIDALRGLLNEIQLRYVQPHRGT